jgi:alpha-galactosidase
LNAEEFIPGIPRDFEVEIGALVSGVGLRGIKAKPLPKSILAQILRDRVAPVETELAAYAQGSRELLLQLVLMDKWTKSERQANALIDEIFALPYHEELRRHYR